jgi:ribosomal protein S12 methylthiotransferase accessory factor
MEYRITRAKKEFFSGTHRSLPPERTLPVIEPIMTGIGVKEIVDITPLDRLGIPVFSAVRPRGARGVDVYSGKGLDPVQARVSAMMEAIERYSGEYHGDQMELASYEEVGITRAVNPEELILPRPLQMGEKVHWTPGWDLLNDEEVFVPSNAVFHPYNTLGMVQPLFRSDTTGLASGNLREEAILHALMEVVEWDALSMAGIRKTMGRRLTIDREEPIKGLLSTFEQAGIDIYLWLLDSRTKIPTIAAAADDQKTKDPSLLVMGVGTHTDPLIAATNALLEVAQSRATQLEGEMKEAERQDLVHRIGYERMKRINRGWFAPADEIALSSVKNLSTPYFDEDIGIVLSEVRQHADRICLCDLSRTVVPAVRIVIPGFEISHIDKDRIRKAH